MTHPDSTIAFDADAQRSDDTAALKARIAELEAAKGQPDEIIDPNTPSDDVEVSKVNTTTVAGEEWQFHTPKTQALMAFGLGTANRKDGQMVMRTMQRFLSFHLLEEDFDRLLMRMSDPKDNFSDDDFGDIMNAVVDTANTSAEAQAPKNGPRR